MSAQRFVSPKLTSFLLTLLPFALTACASHESNRANTEADAEHEIARTTLTNMFDTLDCTDEGHLEAGEIAEHISQVFRPYDRDRSLSLSRPEFSLATRVEDPNLEALAFSIGDANGDGVVSNREFQAYLVRLLTTVDLDRDGEVTPAELGF